ncbi:hypothetical protein FPV67DRAFT_1116080 [Lyophyllum atratum]|nr:hypothetical protein FPV67DRAFT_1116080 [Lyophyllum atratum]
MMLDWCISSSQLIGGTFSTRNTFRTSWRTWSNLSMWRFFSCQTVASIISGGNRMLPKYDLLTRISRQKALRTIKLMFFRDDVKAASDVLRLLRYCAESPPKDLVERWETYHEELSAARDALQDEIREEGSDEEVEEYEVEAFRDEHDRRRRRWNDWR